MYFEWSKIYWSVSCNFYYHILILKILYKVLISFITSFCKSPISIFEFTEINCGSPGILPNGWLEGTRTTLHAVVTFRCQEGMTFEGPSYRTICQADGRWSHPLPRCYGMKTLTCNKLQIYSAKGKIFLWNEILWKVKI